MSITVNKHKHGSYIDEMNDGHRVASASDAADALVPWLLDAGQRASLAQK